MRAQGVPASQAAAFAAIDQSILARKVGPPVPKTSVPPIPFPNLRSSTTSSVDGEAGGGAGGSSKADSVDEDSVLDDKEEEQKDKKRTDKLVSVSHVLTNVIVLQEFLLELAALVQVRAGLFGEVRFV